MRKAIIAVAALLICAGSASAVTQPDAISNLTFWVKADTGVTTNASGGVTAWADQSGNTNDAAGAASFEPDLISGVAELNGKPTLRFDGAGQHMTVANRILTNGVEEFTIIAVAKADVNNNASIVAMRTGLDTPLTQLDQDNTGKCRFIVKGANGATANALGGVYTGTYGFYAGRLVKTSASQWQAQVYFSYNTAENVASAGFGTNTYVTSGDQYIGRVNTIYWDGDIAEILIYEHALSTDEMAQVEEYLADRYRVNYTGADEQNVTEVAGLAMWLRADGGCYQNIYANKPAVDSGVVRFWADSSSETNDAVAVEPPTLATNQVNGYPALDFDGTADRFDLEHPITTDPDQLTIFTVFKQTEGETSKDMIFTHRSHGIRLIQATVQGGNAVLQMRGSGGSLLEEITAPGVKTDGDFSVVMYQFDVVNDRHTVAVNGGAEVVSTYDYGSANFVADTQRIGYYYAGGTSQGAYFDGHIAEIIVYEGVALTAGEKNRIGYYLQNKYGLDASYSPNGTVIMIR
jgi:hypothetical protein